jgi:hypothetical protein
MPRVARGLVAASTLLVFGCSDLGPASVVSLSLSVSSVLLESGTQSQIFAIDQGRGGRALDGRQVGWRSSDELVATVDAAGVVRAGYLTGGTEGTATITATVGGQSATATVRVLPSRAVSVLLGPSVELEYGQERQLSPVVRDARANTLTDRAVNFLSRDTSVVSVSANGLITADGSMGAIDRATYVLAVADGARDSVRVTVSATAIGYIAVTTPEVYVRPGGTRQLRLRMSSPIGVPLVDGNASWSSSDSSLISVSSLGVIRAATGVQSGVATITATAGGQTASALVTLNPCGAAPPGEFPIELRLLGELPSSAMIRALQCAFERMRGYIRAGPPPVTLSNFDASICGAGQPLNETVQGVIIYAWFGVIDGPGGTGANAGPCVTRAVGGLTLLGRMSFDVPDMPAFQANGHLEELVTHEMLHALGIGTLWFGRGLVQGVGPFERFTGERARLACIEDLRGVTQCQNGVPIGDCLVIGGCEWGGSHWRKSVFGREVITSYFDYGENPLSSMTLEALSDLGYLVNPTLADDFVLVTPVSAMLRASGASAWKMSEPIMPIARVDGHGRIVP